jgi:RNA polymerase sigma factor (sigma-70 family)
VKDLSKQPVEKRKATMLAFDEILDSDRSTEQENELLPTRASLLSRLRDWQNESWQEFFELYWKLIYNTARRYGLSDTEAQDVVQETMIGVTKNIPSFRYDPERCSFKTWLMNLILWRIKDQLRKRRPQDTSLEGAVHIPDEKEFLHQWDRDWERNLMNAAVDRVKNEVSPQVFQIFDFCVLQKKGVAETADVLNVSRARVYLAKHRVTNRIVKEINRLKLQSNRAK